MTQNQNWLHLSLMSKVFSLTHNYRRDSLRHSTELRMQPSVNTNNHNGVKFRSQIIETTFNALCATIYSTTISHGTMSIRNWKAAQHLAHSLQWMDSVALHCSGWLGFLVSCIASLAIVAAEIHLNQTDFRFNIHAHCPYCRLIIAGAAAAVVIDDGFGPLYSFNNAIIGISQPFAVFFYEFI